MHARSNFVTRKLSVSQSHSLTGTNWTLQYLFLKLTIISKNIKKDDLFIQAYTLRCITVVRPRLKQVKDSGLNICGDSLTPTASTFPVAHKFICKDR